MDPLEFGAEDQVKKGHPVVAATHVGFRGAALFIYMFGSIFSSSFVTCFIFILLCLAADFWAVKNVTGRFLVGLRWRNQVDPVTGTSTWVYESRSEGNFIIRDQPTRILYGQNYFRGLQTKTSSPQ